MRSGDPHAALVPGSLPPLAQPLSRVVTAGDAAVIVTPLMEFVRQKRAHARMPPQVGSSYFPPAGRVVSELCT